MHICQLKVLTAAGVVASGPTLCTGIHIHDTAAGDYALHNAGDATNAVLKLKLAAAGQVTVMFPQPVMFERGIYLASSTGTLTASILLV